MNNLIGQYSLDQSQVNLESDETKHDALEASPASVMEGVESVKPELFRVIAPYVRFTYSGIELSQGCVKMLDTQYVQILNCMGIKTIVIKPCDCDMYSVKWKSGMVMSSLFCKKLYDFMGWERSKDYEIHARKCALPSGGHTQVLLLDLDTASCSITKNHLLM